MVRRLRGAFPFSIGKPALQLGGDWVAIGQVIFIQFMLRILSGYRVRVSGSMVP